jgi:hypothetical protein
MWTPRKVARGAYGTQIATGFDDTAFKANPKSPYALAVQLSANKDRENYMDLHFVRAGVRDAENVTGCSRIWSLTALNQYLASDAQDEDAVLREISEDRTSATLHYYFKLYGVLETMPYDQFYRSSSSRGKRVPSAAGLTFAIAYQTKIPNYWAHCALFPRPGRMLWLVPVREQNDEGRYYWKLVPVVSEDSMEPSLFAKYESTTPFYVGRVHECPTTELYKTPHDATATNIENLELTRRFSSMHDMVNTLPQLEIMFKK